MSYFKRRWQPSKAQRKAYGERMRSIAEKQAEPIPEQYFYNCTGDCVKGDKITFFNPGKSSERLFGEIVSESYGQKKQQHTFIIEIVDGTRISIKGRNLYKNQVFRMKWTSEEERLMVQAEKHERGTKARAVSAQRKREKLEKELYGEEEIDE